MLDNKVYSDSIERNWKDWRYGHYGVESAAKIPASPVYVALLQIFVEYIKFRVMNNIESDKP